MNFYPLFLFLNNIASVTNVTKVLNVCYNFINAIDIIKKKDKIVIYKWKVISNIMRIISGTARGTKLYTLEGTETRPTLDRVKESLFNIIQSDIQDSNALDLFSGSGAIGLELLSRGAKKAVLCDNSKDAIKIIIETDDEKRILKQIEKMDVEITDRRKYGRATIIFLKLKN